MSFELLKDGTDFLEENNALLKAPDLSADPAGDYVILIDGDVATDTISGEAYYITKA